MGKSRKARVVPRRPARPVRGKRKEAAATPRDVNTANAVPSRAPPFLVAAVGASAGGLEAFSSLVRGISGDAPLALILVQHLARDQHSILPELLQNATKLKVLPARDGQKIEPRHAYVIPPDARMTVSDGELKVRPSQPERQSEGTVDALFRSIADQYQERGIGVVLSGSAHDGAAGVTEIKAAGGLTMAQQPEQASVDGMPRAAIATGAVDNVLSVEEIGGQLVRLSRHPFYSRVGAPESDDVADAAQMQRIFTLLRRTTGIDFTSYKVPTLKRRIERRMALHRLSELGDYVSALERDASELQRLQEELLIHVTAFFREPASYGALEQVVFPRLLSERADDAPIRFWIPGCSSGEEVYSLAITLLEFLGERTGGMSLQIFGTDVSEATIDKARAGVYPASIAADVSPARLRRFFTKFDGGFRINKDIRDRCVFARQDVTRDPPFSKLDLIVCRNLLIYLNQPTQRKVLGVFHYALRTEGVLMLGRSESIGSQADMFSVLDKKFQLYGKKVTGGRPDIPFPPEPAVHRSIPPPKIVTAAAGASMAPAGYSAWDAQNDANRFLLDRYAPPAVVVDESLRIVRSRGSTSPFLELPSGDVSVEILKMVRPELGYALRTALNGVRSRGRPVSKEGLRFKFEGRARSVDLHVAPLGGRDARQFLVMFEDRPMTQAAAARVTPRKTGKKTDGEPMAALERELADTRQQLQSIIDDLGATNEELQSANEEVSSSNEELQSTNEELDTAKEELQSTNEELTTLNDELRGRNEELKTANSDLMNLLASVQIPIVMVTNDLRIRRITPAAERVLNIIPSDIGRPIGHLKPNFLCPDLEAIITEAVDTVTVQERQVEGTEGQVFALQIRPYKSIDNRIDGAVVVLYDVSSVKDQAAALEVALATGEALISTVREPLLVLDSDLTVRKANQAFCDTFKTKSGDTEGRLLYDLGNGQWNLPGLRRLLEEVLPKQKNFEGFEVDHTFPSIGRRRILLDARRIESGRRKQGVILLVLRDVTAHDG
jgi:two-component system, chemotaxis family, CheB/CheR fusion protein